MNNFFVHVGPGKTATSWLQKKIFPNTKDINYLGRTGKILDELFLNWSYLDDYMFSKQQDQLKIELLARIKQNKINLLSLEPFSRAGGIIWNQAHKIHKIIPTAKIIMVLRNPIELIKSFYKYNVMNDNFFLNIENIIDWNRRPHVFYKRRPIYIPDFYYNEIIAIYNELFGTDNICILEYEELTTSPTNFFKRLGNFMEVTFQDSLISKKLEEKTNASPSFDGHSTKTTRKLF